MFWLYYTFRFICFLHVSFHSTYNTVPFHEAEPRGGHQEPGEDWRGGPVLDISYQILNERGDPAYYSEYPATISSSYAVHGVFAILAMVAAELALSKLDIQPTAAPSSIGQIIPLVISGSTAIRATWLFVRLFRKRDGSGFIWPFRRHTFGRLWPIESSDGEDEA
ncbi:hypothetical protein NW762_001471 [Fusarium torreyae]|uniref:Uncharacterized protein n=1 Tax=Fusarium torreyae TaxID=1237075 RepID=A0A9W8SCJ7_9HYPO|nr:hypothetical protein NW762_001471 [Fusarium torreyae]